MTELSAPAPWAHSLGGPGEDIVVFDDVTFTYPDAAGPALRGVSMRISAGELCLVVGPTGSGKSTFLRAINGLVPHFSGGTLAGEVIVDGRSTAVNPPRQLADVVQLVAQNPGRAFVSDSVEEELAYGMESLGLPGPVMRQRVEEALDLLGLAELRDRSLRTLSGGQQQRVAIGAALTMHPRVLVLDEPTSALDPGAAEEVLAALTRLVHDLGITVILAEHRLERVVQYADRLIVIPGDAHSVTSGDPEAQMRTAPVAPPVVQLGRLAGWDPLPLSVRDARAMASGPHGLRAALAPKSPPPRTGARGDEHAGRAPDAAAHLVATVHDLTVTYPGVRAVSGVDLTVRAGEVTALMGRNGAGKSTLLAALVGLRQPDAGQVLVAGPDGSFAAPATLTPAQLIQRVGLVPQEPGDLLCEMTVGAECDHGDSDASLPEGTTAALLRRLDPRIEANAHPRDLSEGQRLSLVLAIVLAARPKLLLLDEPTRGLDYDAKSRLVGLLTGLAAAGTAIVLATHDVELAAEVADRTAVLGDGELLAEGPAAEVITASPFFAPQVSKVLAPGHWLTVSQVDRAMRAG